MSKVCSNGMITSSQVNLFNRLSHGLSQARLKKEGKFKSTMNSTTSENRDNARASPVIPLSHYTAFTRELARRCEISQSAMGSPKNAENRCILFSIFKPWRCYGVPAAIVAFLRRFHGLLSRSCGVLVGDRLRANGVLTACPRRATACTPRFRSGHRACTTSTPRWRRPINSSPFCCGWRT